MERSPKPLEFPESYNAVAVPAPIRTMDAIDERVAEAEDAFFQAITDSLQLSKLALSTFCAIRHRMLVPLNYDQSPARSVRGSDDIISEFWFEGVQPLATVMKVRDDLNWQVASFSKYPLLPKTIEAITDLDMITNIIEPGRSSRFDRQ